MTHKAVKEENMVVPIPTEVIPVWYIEKWKKENAENGSALEFYIEQLIKDWHAEELRQMTHKVEKRLQDDRQR